MKTSKPVSDIISFDINPIGREKSSKVIGYNLTSTATIYVEDRHSEPDTNLLSKNLEQIAIHLLESDNPQLVIAIHGYANKKSDAQSRYKKIYNYAQTICKSNTVFIGYRWPAENPGKDDPEVATNKSNSFADKVNFAFEALPTLLLGTLISSIVLGINTILVLLNQSIITNIIVCLLIGFLLSIGLSSWLSKLGKASGLLPIFPNRVFLVIVAVLIWAIAALYPNNFILYKCLLVLAFLCVLCCGVVLALIALRLSTYPSDRYRANNYGVVDMVEFIRQLDKAIIDKVCKAQGIPPEEWNNIRDISDEKINKSKIKISFINHSLGCEVVTQTVRILSDVFDPNSVRKIGEDTIIKTPSSDIGRVFTLSRLVLVAPDIPIESILSGRANFLRSSLRRFEEAYVFSNEADLALRLASTAANYFSFPAKTRFRGYKLGNVTADRFKQRNEKLERKNYGIVNNYKNKSDLPYKYLELRASNLERISLEQLAYQKQPNTKKVDINRILVENTVADCFTYFDCTDYVDVEANPGEDNSHNQKVPKGLLSRASQKSALNLWWDYILLLSAYFLKIPRYINVHGGYFEGEFSQRLIYELAFLGFHDLLSKNFKSSLDTLSDCCQEKGIQVILGSKFYPKI